VAIIEADIMLDEMLTALGYLGDGVGEKLKTVEPSNILTLDAAWEAHKVRNRIAHSGKDFELNQRETKRVVGLFESVFREFGMI
jgi:deoxyadenosine/deoxycytidine kinase